MGPGPKKRSNLGQNPHLSGPRPILGISLTMRRKPCFDMDEELADRLLEGELVTVRQRLVGAGVMGLKVEQPGQNGILRIHISEDPQ